MSPAEGLIVLPANTMGLGVAKFVWFKILNNSALNCRLILSVMGVTLENDISKLTKSGPVYIPLPRLPYVPGTGRAKAFGLNH